MPQIKARGVKKDILINISTDMILELSEIISCPEEDLTLEHIESTYISRGQIGESYPFIEVCWFDRGQEVQDKVAQCITSYLLREGVSEVDIMFEVLKEDRYYYNGKHF